MTEYLWIVIYDYVVCIIIWFMSCFMNGLESFMIILQNMLCVYVLKCGLHYNLVYVLLHEWFRIFYDYFTKYALCICFKFCMIYAL